MFLGGTRYTPFVIAKSKPSQKPDVAAKNNAARHGFGTGIWKEVSELQRRHDVVMYGNTKGWWSGELFIAFVRYHFGSRPDRKRPPLNATSAQATSALLQDDLQATTAVVAELQKHGEIDQRVGEVQEDRDVVENAVVGVFEVLGDD
ncbi:unnamed protein product [Phytophthora lilii]|uniref:Unnamed protein product n=1 Tax=Phytophthora lilii TaxID=2077276 RepID=A0A9W6X3G0_9STRA|nr:unnamed protein product [Phytophthora lilii]